MSNNSDIIENALNQVISSDEDWVDGDIIIDWVLVACTTNVDREKGYAYPMFFKDGEIPVYRAIGLLETASYYSKRILLGEENE